MPLPATNKASTVNLTISQGSTFSYSFQVVTTNPDGSVASIFDLTGCTAGAKIRVNFPGSVVVVLTCVINTVAAQSTIVISLTPTQTAALTLPGSPAADVRSATIGVWDLELTLGTDTYRFAEGIVTLSREATY